MAIPREIKSAQQRSPSTTITIAAALGGSLSGRCGLWHLARSSSGSGDLAI